MDYDADLHREPTRVPSSTMRGLVGEDVWAEFLRQSFKRWHPAGDILMRQGDSGTHVLAVLRGVAKVERTERNGSTAVLAFRGPGELLGELATMGWGGRLASVITLTRCQVAVMHEAAFTKFVTEYRLHAVLTWFAQARLREATRDGNAFSYRLAAALVHIADLLVLSGSDAQQPLELPLRRPDLAQYLGVSRHTVTDGLASLAPYSVGAGRMRIVVEDLSVLRQGLADLAV